MSDWLQQHVDGKTLYVVSDLHMGDGTAKDNFKDYQPRFEDFLADVVERDRNGLLVLAGDMFEFWQSQHGAVVRRYLDLLKRLVKRGTVFIVGNHDIDLWGFVGLALESPLIKQLATDLIVRRNGKQIRICHGQEFDKYNDPRKLMWLGRIATIGAGQAEMWLGTEIAGRPTESLLERIFAWVARQFRSRFGKTAGEKVATGKKIDETRDALEQYHAQYPSQTLVAGHTHDAGWYGDWYVNAGCWQSEQAHYVKIAPGGQIELLKWPQQEHDRTELWGGAG